MSAFTATETAPSKLVLDWTDAELAAAAAAYLQMLKCELEGTPYVKSAVNLSLRQGPLTMRKKGAIEFRMRNISATLYDLRIPHIAGYLPARNVGPGVKERIKAVLTLHGLDNFRDYTSTADTLLLDERVAALRKKPLGPAPQGTQRPKQITSQTTSFVRDPAVKRWVLQAAKGICEGCALAAPFIGRDGYPYLEVHHVMHLGSYGSDRISNAVALCPNCHRRCHFAMDRDEFKLSLYERIDRLEIEVPSIEDADLAFASPIE